MLFDHAAARETRSIVFQGAAGNVGAFAVQFAYNHNIHALPVSMATMPSMFGWR
jgi:NADPH:quinone reductase-like Zn-dependent oxidoreductase